MMRRTSLVTASPAATRGVHELPAPLVPETSHSVRNVAVTLWRLRAHLDGRRAKYLLRVENRGSVALDTFTYVLSPGASGEVAASASVSVPGSASLSVKLVLALPHPGPALAITEIRTTNGTLVFAETERPRSRAWPALWFVALLALCGSLWLASALATPAITALAAPSDVRASRPFWVAYALGRSNAADYRVFSASGFVVATGTLAASQGAFEVALPVTATRKIYAVRVTAHGRLGDAARSVRVVAEPDPRPSVLPAPRPVVAVRPRLPEQHPFGVDRLALAEPTVAGGKPVVVYYRVASADGVLRLIDQLGTVRAEALLDRRGNSILIAPYVEADQDFRVVLHASRGEAQAEKSVSLRVTKERSLDDVLATARRKNDGPIVLVKATVAPGEPIEVGIVRYEPGLRVALVDPQGQEVAASTVADDQNEVMLTAPAIAGRARYTVTATYVNGVSEETVVRDLTIGGPAPRATP